MDEMLAIVLAVAAVGVAGGYLLARYAKGAKAMFGWPLWLVLPFLLLGISVFFSVPDMSHGNPEQARANAVTSVVIISLFTAPVWFGSTFLGWIVGRIFRRRASNR
jgi:hypothetical protein